MCEQSYAKKLHNRVFKFYKYSEIQADTEYFLSNFYLV